MYCKSLFIYLIVFTFISLFTPITSTIASTSSDDIFYNHQTYSSRLNDPLEKINRKVYSMNDYIIKEYEEYDRKKLKKKRKIRIGKIIRNFFENASTPISTINLLLQQEPDKAITSMWRFIINSTLGLGGLFDIASSFKMENNVTSFEKTFIKYNIDHGMYVVLPLLGPKTLREIIANTFDFFCNPVFYLVPNRLILFLTFNIYDVYTILDYLDYNELIMDNSLDGYLKMRSLYIQQNDN